MIEFVEFSPLTNSCQKQMIECDKLVAWRIYVMMKPFNPFKERNALHSNSALFKFGRFSYNRAHSMLQHCSSD